MQARATAKTAATMEPRESIFPAALWPVELGEAELELELELELPDELESLDEDDEDDEEEVDLAELPELDALPPAVLEGAVSRVLGMLVEAADLLSPELSEAAAVVLPESAVAVALAESEPESTEASAVALAAVGSAAAAEVVVAASAGAEDEESLDEEEPSSAATAEPTPIGAEDPESDEADEDGAGELLEDALESSDESLGASNSAGWSERFWAVTEGEAEAEEDEE